MSDIRAKIYRDWWYAVWADENGKTVRRALRTKDRHEAERRLIDLKKDMMAPPGSLVGDMVEAYLKDKEGRIADHGRLLIAWRNARDCFAHLRPDQIDPEVCRDYASRRRLAGMSDATILKEINVVRQGINWRGAAGARFEAPSAPPPRDRHLTKDEYRRLLGGCVQPHVRLFTALAISTAGRKSAILELIWDRVDFDRGMIRLGIVGERNRKGRAVVPMTDSLRRELVEARKAAQTPYVVEFAGKHVLDIKKGFAAAVARAGLTNVTPHDLRHTAAVWMAEGGVSMAEIAQFLGHSDESVTFRVYARFSPNHLRKAASSLEF